MRLEERRRCGWLSLGDERKIVWAGGGAMSTECPRTAITAESAAWLEMFATWRVTGLIDSTELSAKDQDALAVLKREWERTGHDER